VKAEAFVIHLARAQGRAPQVERLCKNLPMPVTVINAIDAETLSDQEIARVYRPGLHRPHYPFSLRRTEIACFLSHRRAWQMILDRGLDAALIVEDDVEPMPEFQGLLQHALTSAGRGDFLRFPKKARERGPTMAEDGPARIFVPRSVALGMQAQLVGRDAAAELLAFTREFDRPVDTIIQMRWLHGVRILSSSPVAVREVAAELGGTTVQGKAKPLAEILSREFNRRWYRLALQARNFRESLTRSRTGSVTH